MRGRLVVAATLLASSPAFAGWGGAEWGMSREDVALVRGETPEREGEFDRYRGSVGPFSVGVTYGFEGDSLSLIEVSPLKAGDCLPLMNVVRETYGAPFSADEWENGSAEKWSDEKNGNLVNLFSIKVVEILSCHVLYEPMKEPNSGGF